MTIMLSVDGSITVWVDIAWVSGLTPSVVMNCSTTVFCVSSSSLGVCWDATSCLGISSSTGCWEDFVFSIHDRMKFWFSRMTWMFDVSPSNSCLMKLWTSPYWAPYCWQSLWISWTVFSLSSSCCRTFSSSSIFFWASASSTDSVLNPCRDRMVVFSHSSMPISVSLYFSTSVWCFSWLTWAS